MYELRRIIVRHQPFLLLRARIASWLGIPSSVLPPEKQLCDTRLGVKLRLRVDGMFTQPWLFGDYEPYATKIFNSIINQGDTIFDVGANYGWYSAVFGVVFRKKIKVYAFEPVPSTFSLLEETISLNGLESVVRPINSGLSEESGQFTIHLFDNLSIGHASSSDLNRNDARPVVCKVTTLDAFVEENGVARVDFLKIDVEGSELDVLKGGKKTLARDEAPVIYFEINAKCVSSRNIHPDQLVELLTSYGYTTFLTFSMRNGIKTVTGSLPVTDGDYLAFKPQHAARMKRLMGVRRVLR